MRIILQPCWCLACLLVSLGCGDQEKLVTYENEGFLCFQSANAAADDPKASHLLKTDESLFIDVYFPHCRDSSLYNAVETSCFVSLRDNTLVVQSKGLYVRDSISKSCSADAPPLVVRCQAPPMSAGVYEVKHGDHTQTLTIPTAVNTCAPYGDGPRSNLAPAVSAYGG